MPLLDKDHIRELFLSHLDSARRKWKFEVWAYVMMPNHVHLLIHPLQKKYSMSAILRDIKRPFAREMLKRIRADAPAAAKLLVAGIRDGIPQYRFWQAGGGYDRNLFTPEAIYASIGYIHANPVRRGLCESDVDWKWLSARWYAGMADCTFEVDRCNAVVFGPRRLGAS